MKTKTLVLTLFAITAGVFAFNRANNAPLSDLRDAVADPAGAGSEAFNTALSAAGKSDSQFPVPAPAPEKSVYNDKAVSQFLVVGVFLNSQAFKGETGEETKANVDAFIAQLGKKMVVDYHDTSAIKYVTVALVKKSGIFSGIVDQFRADADLKALPEVKKIAYRMGIVKKWDVEFKGTLYRDRIDKILAPVAAKDGLAVEYGNSVEVLDRGDLNFEILADFKDPAAYARQLSVRFPGKVRYADLYMRTQGPGGNSSSSLYRPGKH